MNNLVSLDLRLLHNAEMGQLVVRFYEDFAKAGLNAGEDPDFATVYTALQAQLPTYNAALDQVRASEESARIADADRDRDRNLQAFRDALKPFRRTTDDAEAAAYTALQLLLSEYRDVEDASYEEETNRLNTLVKRLQSADYAAHTEVLGIAKFAARLAAANTAFNDLFAHRSFQTSQKPSYDLRKLRNALTADYRKMSNYLSAIAAVKPSGFHSDALAVLNNGRSYYGNTIVARRNAKPSGTPPDAAR